MLLPVEGAIQAFHHEALPHEAHRARVHAESFGDLLVGPTGTLCIDFEQDLRMGDLSSVSFALGYDGLELWTLRRRESNDVPLVHRIPPLSLRPVAA